MAGTSRGNTAPTSLDKLIASVSGQIASDARLPEADLRERLTRLAERFVRIHDLVPISDAVLLEVEAYLFKYAVDELNIGLDTCKRVFGEQIWLEFYAREMFLYSLFTPGLWPYTRASLIPELDRLHTTTRQEAQPLVAFGLPLQKAVEPLDGYVDRRALYFVKLPVRVDECDGRLRYAWAKQAPEIAPEDIADGEFEFLAPNWGFFRGSDGELVTRHGERVSECSYEEAATLPVFSDEEVRRIEQLRPVVLELKLRTSRHLATALAVRSTTSVWDACLRIMTDCLTGQDVEFLLGVDTKYGVDDVEGHIQDEVERLPDPGGVSNLIDLIELCERAVTIGLHDEEYRLLKPYVDCSNRDRWIFQHRQTSGWKCEFDYPAVRKAYGAFREGLNASYAFSDLFRGRVRVSLDEEFRDVGPLGILIPRKLQPEFENRLRRWAGAFASLEILPPRPEDVLRLGTQMAGGRIGSDEPTPSVAGLVTAPVPLGDSASRSKIAALAPEWGLTPVQEEEAARHGFKSRLPIRVTGRREGDRYVVEIGGADVPLAAADFKLFVRLAAELMRHMEGAVKRTDLVEEGFLPHHAVQAINRLRSAVRPALGSLAASQFVENTGYGAIRLSTHPTLIEVDPATLKNHEDKDVRALAGDFHRKCTRTRKGVLRRRQFNTGAQRRIE